MSNFKKARWQALTGPVAGWYGLSFRMGDGQLVRLNLNHIDACRARDALIEATREAIAGGAHDLCH